MSGQETPDPVGDLQSAVWVLVADDNAINLAVVQAIVEAVGAEISAVGDGHEALERLRSEAFDLVLMDVHMPRMGGIEALGRIRAGEAGPPEIPVIALTADAMAGVDEQLLAHGFDGSVSKPISPAELIATIGELLGRSRSARQMGAVEGPTTILSRGHERGERVAPSQVRAS